MLKKYKHSVLTDDQIKWIVKQKIEGKLKNEEIAAVQGISVRRVQQIYSLYKKNGSLPVLKKAGRHKALPKKKGKLLSKPMDNLNHAPAIWST